MPSIHLWESLSDVVDEPFQESSAETVGIGRPEQPSQYVAVAYLVIRVPENIECVELWYQPPMVCPEPGVINQLSQVAFQGSTLL